MKTSLKVRIVESYFDYEPPAKLRATVEKLLATVPDKYFRQLGDIVLTNLSGQARRDRLGTTKSRGRRIKKARVIGFYGAARDRRAAYIQIYADQLDRKQVDHWFPVVSELCVAHVLFHELGHHAHVLNPEHREREDVADFWRSKFGLNFFRRAYWYLFPLILVLAKIKSLRRDPSWRNWLRWRMRPPV